MIYRHKNIKIEFLTNPEPEEAQIHHSLHHNTQSKHKPKDKELTKTCLFFDSVLKHEDVLYLIYFQNKIFRTLSYINKTDMQCK